MIEESRAVCVGTPPKVAVVVLECAAGILQAAGGHPGPALSFLEGKAKMESLRRVFASEDIIQQMQGLCSRSPTALASVAGVEPMVKTRLAAAGITSDRALLCSAAI